MDTIKYVTILVSTYSVNRETHRYHLLYESVLVDCEQEAIEYLRLGQVKDQNNSQL